MNRWRFREILFLLGLVLILPAPASLADGWGVTQLTNNDYDDLAPDLSGARLVWCAKIAGSDQAHMEIMLYDGAETTRLTENDSADMAPRVSAEGVCWQGKSQGPDWEVFYHTSAGTVQLTDNDRDDLSPKIAGSRVVWHGGNNADSEVYLYDGSGTVQLTDNDYRDTYPVVSADCVAWNGMENDRWNVYVHDGDGVKQITDDNDVDQSGPCFGEAAMFWRTEEKTEEHGLLGRIVMYDGVSETLLTNDDLDDQAPAACGGRAAWRSRDMLKNYDDPTKGSSDIFLYTGSAVLRLTDDEYEDSNPVLSEHFVVWSAYDGHDNEIFVYDGASIFQLTDNDYNDKSPCISGHSIAWVGYGGQGAGGDGEIFLAVHTPEPCAVLLLLFGVGGLTRRGRARTIRRSYDYTHRRHG